MIKLTLPEPKKRDKYYIIFIEENLRFNFTNMKKAKKFKFGLECLLNDSFDYINEAYSDTHKIYRSMFLFIDSNVNQHLLFDEFRVIEHEFLLLIQELYKNSANGGYFIYHKLLKLFRTVEKVLTLLSIIAEDKRQYLVVKKCKTHLRHLSNEYKLLLNLKDTLFNKQITNNVNYNL